MPRDDEDDRPYPCEDAPCCGCCPRDPDDSGMTKDDYLNLMSRDDYDEDMDFSMNG